MAGAVLSAGTKVKHGTLSSYLGAVLEQGIGVGRARDVIRDEIEEQPKVQAVYVATLGAYVGAYRSFAASHFRWFSTQDGNNPIPVVLNITLGEDCTFIADEDFVALEADGSVKTDSLETRAADVWDRFGSAALTRPGGIPPDWIDSFEYPQLCDKATIDRGGRPAYKFWKDVDLFVFSMGMPHMPHPLESWQDQACKWKDEDKLDFSCLSNRERFSKAGMARFKELSFIRDRARRQRYCVSLESAVSMEIREAGLQGPESSMEVYERLKQEDTGPS
ncbi:MAG: hypothetical protein HOC05_17135 [Gemmatimonadetes bacterium]|jgi:hypothetical protein|nr:hypothetical protein [Gemmatimonadota bacterium]MBT5141082.1 hypothetical protein [Gemmatimonadota bacterium]MBT5592069.1 hypothetical protein [Gemmatimonadota bacterium]MBT5964651.1 hypothetical protein [Gemmatimonadota bacterium]MBT6628366.1 hypothetical protein [Gemmatimonadota bacterium]